MSSPPASPAMPKYKLAEYRYGREEMLALYVKDNKVGKCLKQPTYFLTMPLEGLNRHKKVIFLVQVICL